MTLIYEHPSVNDGSALLRHVIDARHLNFNSQLSVHDVTSTASNYHINFCKFGELKKCRLLNNNRRQTWRCFVTDALKVEPTKSHNSSVVQSEHTYARTLAVNLYNSSVLLTTKTDTRGFIATCSACVRRLAWRSKRHVSYTSCPMAWAEDVTAQVNVSVQDSERFDQLTARTRQTERISVSLESAWGSDPGRNTFICHNNAKTPDKWICSMCRQQTPAGIRHYRGSFVNDISIYINNNEYWWDPYAN